MLSSRPRLVPTSGWELPGELSIHAGVRIEGDDREGCAQLCLARPLERKRACRVCREPRLDGVTGSYGSEICGVARVLGSSAFA